MKRLFGAILIVSLLVVAGSWHRSDAALQLPEGIQEQLSIDITPTVPGPNETVTIRVRSFSSNLNGATIFWYVNDNLALSGTGETKFTTTIGDVGTQTVVVVRIQKAEGGELARELIFSPADLELVFEPLTYTPPFYEGRSVMTHQAPYKVVAIPRFIDTAGKRYNERELVYTWNINGRNVPEATGYGKYSLVTKGALISRSFDVQVQVETPDGKVKAKKTLYIAPEEAELLFYKDHPLYGILYNRALEEEIDIGSDTEITVSAVPFFFGVDRANDLDLEYEWKIDEKPVITAANENELTLRVPDAGGYGTNQITLSARNMQDILQAGYKVLHLSFGDNPDDEF